MWLDAIAGNALKSCIARIAPSVVLRGINLSIAIFLAIDVSCELWLDSKWVTKKSRIRNAFTDHILFFLPVKLFWWPVRYVGFPSFDLHFSKAQNRVLMDSQADLGYDKLCFIIAVLIMNFSALSINYGVGTHDVLACAGAGIGYGCALWTFAPPLAAVAGGYFAFAMLLIAVIDVRRFIIPDFLSLPLVPIGIAVSAGLSPQNMEYVVFERIGAAAVAGIALYAVRWIYQRYRKIEGLGLGDVKLAAAAGAWVGLGALGMTLLLATCAALIATLFRQYLNNSPSIGLQTPVPFGSFIAPSTVVMWTVVLWYSQADQLQML